MTQICHAKSDQTCKAVIAFLFCSRHFEMCQCFRTMDLNLRRSIATKRVANPPVPGSKAVDCFTLFFCGATLVSLLLWPYLGAWSLYNGFYVCSKRDPKPPRFQTPLKKRRQAMSEHELSSASLSKWKVELAVQDQSLAVGQLNVLDLLPLGATFLCDQQPTVGLSSH